MICLTFFLTNCILPLMSDDFFYFQGAPSFGIDYAHDTFVKDGSPIRLMSGSIHYFRVHPDDWTDRLTKLKFAGFNTVQTWV